MKTQTQRHNLTCMRTKLLFDYRLLNRTSAQVGMIFWEKKKLYNREELRPRSKVGIWNFTQRFFFAILYAGQISFECLHGVQEARMKFSALW